MTRELRRTRPRWGRTNIRLPVRDIIRTDHTIVTEKVALAWQNERGIRGEWSEILSTVIP